MKQINIANALRLARKKAGLTQKYVAETTGVLPETISQLERGKHTNPTLKTLVSLADCYGCGLDDLCGFESAKMERCTAIEEPLEEMVISAERYAFGRRTHIVKTTVDYIVFLMPRLSDWCLSILRNDMKYNAEMSERTGNKKNYGDSCDLLQWERFNTALNAEIERRLSDGDGHDLLR